MDDWRRGYDRWKTSGPGTEVVLDEDGEPVDQDELDAQAEAAAEARAEREREDRMFEREERDSWL